MRTKTSQILYFLGALAYLVNFCILAPFEIKLPFPLKMVMILLMLIYVYLMAKELIQQRKENQQKLLEATEEEKLKIRENQKFMLLMFGALILVVAILFGAVYVSQ
jgi:uncharacterized membrane protein